MGKIGAGVNFLRPRSEERSVFQRLVVIISIRKNIKLAYSIGLNVPPLRPSAYTSVREWRLDVVYN